MKVSKTVFVMVTGFLMLTVGCGRKADENMSQVKEALAEGKLKEAQEMVAGAEEADSTGHRALYGKALIDEYQGFEWDAYSGYLEASRANNGYVPAMEAFISTALSLEQYPNALLMARLLVPRLPDSPRPHMYMADIYMRTGEGDSARQALSLAEAKGADQVDLAMARAEIDIRLGDDQAAAAALRKLSSLKSNTAEQYEKLASLFDYVYLGDSAIYYLGQAIEQDAGPVARRLKMAQYLYNDRHYENAYQAAYQLTKEAEGYGPAYVVAAYAAHATGKFEDPEMLFSAYAQLRELSPPAIEKHAAYYEHFGIVEAAARELNSAFIMAVNLQYPDDYLTLILVRGEELLLATGQMEMASLAYKENKAFLEHVPEEPFFRANLAYYSPEHGDTAVKLVDDQVQLNWNNREWLQLAADYYFRTGQRDRAEPILLQLLELPFPRLEDYFHLLEIYQAKAKWTGVEELSGRILFRYQNNPGLMERFRDLFLEAGDVEKALSLAERLYLRNPDHVPYIESLSDLSERTGDPARAYRLFQEYRQRHTESAESYFYQARFEYSRKLFDSARVHVEKALSLVGDLAPAIELKGKIHYERGEIDSALACFRQVVVRNWPTPEAYYYLSRHFLETGDSLLRAEGLAMAAIRYFKNDRRGFLLLGDIYAAQGKPKMARTQYLKGVREFPDDAEYHFKLGRSYVTLSEKAKAKESLRQALKLGLSPSQKAEAEALLSGM